MSSASGHIPANCTINPNCPRKYRGSPGSLTADARIRCAGLWGLGGEGPRSDAHVARRAPHNLVAGAFRCRPSRAASSRPPTVESMRPAARSYGRVRELEWRPHIGACTCGRAVLAIRIYARRAGTAAARHRARRLGARGRGGIRRTLRGVRSRLTVGPGRSCYRVGIAAPGCVGASWEHSMNL